eukprot:XP_015572484.1 DEAD-box ATP-dependent RNA helicase 56 [Ricinus communis]
MGETRDNDAYEEELLDYEEEEEKAPDSVAAKVNGESAKKGYVGIHSSGFRDFLLKPELLRAIVDSGFEHPSEVQHECIPQAILGMDVICQAKSGMGKTAVFVLSTLQQIEPTSGQVIALVLCHTRELAYQICHEFERFSTYLPDTKVAVFYGGVHIKIHKDLLKNECPHIVVGTPGRILALARDKDLSLKNVRHFILDECDKMLESLDMRRDVQEIFKMTPHDKQVMMFSATLSKEIRPVCKKFMQDPMEIYVDDEAKLTLHGLVQDLVYTYLGGLDSSYESFRSQILLAINLPKIDEVIVSVQREETQRNTMNPPSNLNDNHAYVFQRNMSRQRGGSGIIARCYHCQRQGNDNQGIENVKQSLKREFDIKDLGQLSYFLGIEMAKSSKSLFLSQRKYTLELLKETEKTGAKLAITPMETKIKLNLEDGEPLTNIGHYQRLVGKLIYFTVTRPDISFAVSMMSQFMHAPRTSQLEAIDRILRYLKGTPRQGIWMKKNNTSNIVGFSDADWAGSCDRKSTTGYCVFVGGNLEK